LARGQKAFRSVSTPSSSRENPMRGVT
jgi:hypothetical protein